MTESPDPNKLFFDMLMLESERGRILLLAAKIDQLLGDLLRAFFKPSRSTKPSDDKLFRTMGLLGTFSARIEMAQRVGLISNQSAECLDILRDIRNDCAHGMEPFTYQQGSHGDKFKDFIQISYKVSGLEGFFQRVEKYEASQATAEQPAITDHRFMLVALSHLLMLQTTLIDLKVVGNNFTNLAGAKFTTS